MVQAAAPLERGLGVIERPQISRWGGVLSTMDVAPVTRTTVSLPGLRPSIAAKVGGARVSGRGGSEERASPAVEGSVGTASVLGSCTCGRGGRVGGSPESWAPSMPWKESVFGSFFVLDSVTSRIGTDFIVDEPHTPISAPRPVDHEAPT